jgi:integrase/recombinase XerD
MNKLPTGQAIVGTQDRALVASTPAMIEDWLKYCRDADDASPKTVQAYRKGMQVFTDWLRDTGNAGAVTPAVVVQFKGWLAGQYSPQTVNLRLSAVRSFYRWCVITERLRTSPAESVKGMKRPNSKTHKRDALSNGEVVAVLDTCSSDDPRDIRDRAILSLMAYCALREVEVHRANIGNLKTQGDRLVLEVQGKGRREADEVVVIPTSQEMVIRDWVAVRSTSADQTDDAPLFVSLSNRTRGRRLTTRAIRAMVKARFAQAGVVGNHKTTHSLRHSAITNAIRHGATPMQVQAMARHASFDTTLGYFHQETRTANPAEDFIEYEA